MSKSNTRVLAEIAIGVALATVLSTIKIFSMPYGGSVTLGSMVPILLIAFRRDVKVPIIGVVVGLAGRFICHFISGVVFFGMYAPEGMSPVLYSAIYNGGYIGAELVISAVLIYMLVQRNVLNMDL